jgi:hypothetical protein
MTNTSEAIAVIRDLLNDIHSNTDRCEKINRCCQIYKFTFENSFVLTRNKKFKAIVGKKFFEFLVDSNDFVCFIPNMIKHYLLSNGSIILVRFENEYEFMDWTDEQQMEFIMTNPLILSLHRIFEYMVSKMMYNVRHKNRCWWIQNIALLCNIQVSILPS